MKSRTSAGPATEHGANGVSPEVNDDHLPDLDRPFDEVRDEYLDARRRDPDYHALLQVVIDEDGSIRGDRIEVPANLVAAIERRAGSTLFASSSLAQQVADELLARLASLAAVGQPPAAHNAVEIVVHQDSELVPDRELYLRMARRGDFPSRKEGKKVFARWCDVRDAFCAPPRHASSGSAANESEASKHDDVLCRELLIAPARRGKR